MDKQDFKGAQVHVRENKNTIPMSKLRDAFTANNRAHSDLLVAQLRAREADNELRRAVFDAGLLEALDVNKSRLKKLFNDEF